MTEENLSADSWSKYWTQASGEVGCLPGAPKALGNLLDGIWETLAKHLNQGDQVIDLACGNGVVGASLRTGNPELNITGVDYANLDGVETPDFPIVGSTSITDMPFDDNSFDCAVSQFGIEYADTVETGRELSRVLKSGGSFQFITHCAESVIVKSNLARHEILEHIYYSPSIRTNAKFQKTNDLQNDFNALVMKYGEQSLIIEIASAIRSTLSDSPETREAALIELWNGMSQEINIINALRKAAVSQDNIQDWIKTVGSEFSFNNPETITYDGEILCWSLSGSKS